MMESIIGKGKKKKNLGSEMPLVSDYYHFEEDPNCEVIGENEPFDPVETAEKLRELKYHTADIDYAIKYKENQIYNKAKSCEENDRISVIRNKKRGIFLENEDLKLTKGQRKFLKILLRSGIAVSVVSGIIAYCTMGASMIFASMMCGFSATLFAGIILSDGQIVDKVSKKGINSVKKFSFNLIDNLRTINKLKRSKTLPEYESYYSDIDILQENKENTEYDKYVLREKLREYKEEHPEEKITVKKQTRLKNSFEFIPEQERNIVISGIRKKRVR